MMNNYGKFLVFVVAILGIIFIVNQKYSKIESVKKLTNILPRNKSKYEDNSQKRVMLGFPSYDSVLKEKFRKLVDRKATALDLELISFVEKVIDHPAPPKATKLSHSLLRTPQAKEIDDLFDHKKYGFFVEAGSLDGERSSNTIWLEKKRHWTGLLIEPDPLFYTQLVGKNRHAWSINGCISPYDYVSEISFVPSSGGAGKLALKRSRAPKVPCYPLLTLLAAINIFTVDFFSLDVEGAEGIILNSLPFEKLQILTLAVEYAHGDKKKYKEIMNKRGYEMVKDMHIHKPEIDLYVHDFIFVKKNYFVH